MTRPVPAILSRPAPGARAALACVLAASLGCHGPVVQEQVDVLTKQLEKARLQGAERCSPRWLAVAETNTRFAQSELMEGNAGRADEHAATAAKAVQKAIDESRECGPQKVLIKQQAPVVKVEKKDTDGDGILDTDDKCVREPEDIDKFEDEDGCPDLDNDKDGLPDRNDACPDDAGPVENQGCPIRDTDSDGIPDDIDKCKLDPEDRDGFEDDDGCPEADNDVDGTIDAEDDCPIDPGPKSNKGCPVLDTDGDGLNDPDDRCPEKPEDKDGFQDQDGCPDEDNDEDGVLDVQDECPNDPGIAELKGCPPKDRDGDSVPDHIDQCPDQEGVVELAGCPRKYTLVVLKKEKIEIKQQVHFATNKHVILADSFGLLDQVAQVLKDYPNIKVKIEGHTDSQADDEFNLKLSQRRADSVKEYLVKAGISEDRMNAVGFGETMPIASNKTANGRASNRRVEFNIMER